MKREKIEEKYKWDLSSYFLSDEEYLKEVELLKKDISGIKKFEGKLTTSDNIFRCFKFREKIGQRIGRAYVYGSLRVREDKSDSGANERFELIESVGNEYGELSSFFNVEISELEKGFVEDLMKEKRFKNYREFFRLHLKNREHILSQEGENILAAISSFVGGYSEVQSKFEDVDLKFPKVKDSHGKAHELNGHIYLLLQSSPDGELRKNSYITYHKSFGDFNSTLASNYISSVKETSTLSRIRKFDSSIKGALFGEEIPRAVYDTVIQRVHEKLPLMYRYFEIKRKKLGVKKLGIYDMFAPVVKKNKAKIKYEDAFQLIKEALKPLGEEYSKILDVALKDRWTDVFPNDGKDGGAFSWGAYGAAPILLLNYTENIESVFTFAHELGHSIHSYLTNKNQSYSTSGHEIFVAEVASTVNEMFLVRYLLKNAASNDEREGYFDRVLTMARTTIFRQVMFSEFEEFTHDEVDNKRPLSKDILNEKYRELNSLYFGKSVHIPSEAKFEWSRIPHFFSPFYVYKYATGLISAMLISERILKDPKSVEGYLKFLSGGTSLPPLELLKLTGVDLENEDAYTGAFEFLSNILTMWEDIS